MKPDSPGLIQCNICGNRHFRVALLCTDHFVTGETFPILECSQCGFRITGGAPGATEIGRYYQSEEYVSHSNTTKGVINRLYHLVRNLMLREKLSIIRRSSGLQTGRLLDLGTGTGFFLHYLRENGWKVTGVEKSESARQFAADNWDLQVLDEDAFFSLPASAFDVITLWHVLEHLHHPENYWVKMREIIQPGGTLVIALPNPNSYDAKHYKSNWAAWDVPRHLWHFTPDNIQQAAFNAGFTFQKMYRMPFDAFYVSMLSEKYRKSSLANLKGMMYGKISWLISLFNKRRSSSLIYIFRQ